MAGRKLILILVMIEFCFFNSAWLSESKRKQFSSPNDLDKYLRRMVIGKRLTFAADLDKYLWKQASEADIVAFMKMMSSGRHPASSKEMASFLRKIFSGKRPEVDKDEYKKSTGEIVKEKKSFASFRWRPVDGKSFVFYI